MTQEKAAAKDFFGMKAKRESMGMTLKDVFLLTRISVVNLEAIENGDFAALPVSIYAKNFIKIYAQALDLDSKPILAGYEAYWKTPQVDQPETPQVEKPVTPVKDEIKEKEQESKIAPEPEKPIQQEKPVPEKSSPAKKISIILIFLIIIIAAVAMIFFQERQPVTKVAVNQQPIAETPAPPPAITTPAIPPPANSPVNLPTGQAQAPQSTGISLPAPNEVKQVSSQPAPPPQKSSTQVKSSPVQNVPVVEKKEPASVKDGAQTLIIRAKEETWLKIKIDQNPSFQFLLKPGQAVKRKGAGFSVDIGNAGGVTVELNGKTVENLGKSGEVRHLELP